jgi:hypothetical protein
LTKEEIFNIWAPRDAIWSDWAKPVLFAHLTQSVVAGVARINIDVSKTPRPDGHTLLVLDLPGDRGVAMGLVMAAAGWRPVPLYNAIPPRGTLTTVCDVRPILRALFAGTFVLRDLKLVADAPPAFLLDSMRRVGDACALVPGAFDNRSISLPTDFPSANLLLSRGLHRAILVQSAGTLPQEDLAHTLLRWQQAGMQIEAISLADPGEPTPITVRRPFMFREIWQRLIATFGLIRSPLGGFGGQLPMAASGG